MLPSNCVPEPLCIRFAQGSSVDSAARAVGQHRRPAIGDRDPMPRPPDATWLCEVASLSDYLDRGCVPQFGWLSLGFWVTRVRSPPPGFTV